MRNTVPPYSQISQSTSLLAPSPTTMGPSGVSDIFYTAVTPSETEALLLQNNHFDRTGGVVVGLPRSCADNTATNGPTTIYPLGKEPLEVRCDLSSPGGPWTTFQRRVDTTSFDRDWDAYKTGFANAEKGKDGSFWLGNDHIHELTKGGAKLRVDLCTLPENNLDVPGAFGKS